MFPDSIVLGQQCEIINQIVLVYDDGNRSDEDNDLDFMELEASGPHFKGHGHSHKMPQVEMVAPATTQEEQQKDEKKRKFVVSRVQLNITFCPQRYHFACRAENPYISVMYGPSNISKQNKWMMIK